MSTYSVLTSDLRRNPSIMRNLEKEIAARTGFAGHMEVTEHDGITTVTAVTA